MELIGLDNSLAWIEINGISYQKCLISGAY